MGWTTTRRERGLSTREFFQRMLSDKQQIIASAMVDSVFYAAVREGEQVWAFIALTSRSSGYYNFGWKDMDERMGPSAASAPARVLDQLSPLLECHHEDEYCLWCGRLITEELGQWVSHQREGQIPEVAGPQCYSGYLTTAPRAEGGRPFHAPGGTPPCGTCSARNWRKSCRASIERRAAVRAMQAGTRIRLAREVEFRTGHKGTDFELLDIKRGHVRGTDGRTYSLGADWFERRFEVISEISV